MTNRKISAARGALTLAVVLRRAPALRCRRDPGVAVAAALRRRRARSRARRRRLRQTAPTCETIVSAGTVQVLTDAGWTFQPKEFVIGDVPLPDGLLCFWADYSVGSDHGQLYGWSPITRRGRDQAQSSLLADGWTREDGAEGMYFTENPQYSMGTGHDGYGMTYLFEDGWVKLADTKQSLLLIGWNG